MSSDFQCSECAAWVNIPRTLKTVTCRRCGEVYTCNTDGDAPRKMYPALSMYPITELRLQEATGVYSKWMPTHTRPVREGLYEARFRTTEPAVVLVVWNGVRFVTPVTRERIQMREFLTWRGALA